MITQLRMAFLGRLLGSGLPRPGFHALPASAAQAPDVTQLPIGPGPWGVDPASPSVFSLVLLLATSFSNSSRERPDPQASAVAAPVAARAAVEARCVCDWSIG